MDQPQEMPLVVAAQPTPQSGVELRWSAESYAVQPTTVLNFYGGTFKNQGLQVSSNVYSRDGECNVGTLVAQDTGRNRGEDRTLQTATGSRFSFERCSCGRQLPGRAYTEQARQSDR